MISITVRNTASDLSAVTLRDGIATEGFAPVFGRIITGADNKSGMRSGCGFFWAGFINSLDDLY